jgi:hypothetical protein
LTVDGNPSASSDAGVVARPWPFADFVNDVASEAGRTPVTAAGDGPACLHFSGLGLFGSEILASAELLTERLRTGKLAITDILSATGYFTAVVSAGGELLFLTDLLGLEHLYVYDGAGGPIISNRLHALIAHLKAKKIGRKLNASIAAMSLWSGHAFFSQCHAHDLALQDTSLVPMDRYLTVSAGRVQFRWKPVLAEAFGGIERPYESLLDEAARQIRSNVAAIGDSDLFDHVSAELSGGRDSRLVFGALVNLGRASRTPIITRDLPGTRDLRHALRIVEHYHAPIYAGEPDCPEAFVETAEDALRQWRSYYMGMYHKMSLPSWSIRGARQRSIRLTGGCGEIYRSFWSRWLSRVLAQAKPDKTIEALFERLLPGYPATHRGVTAAVFAESILSLPGETAVEKLDNHYLFFRNRMHFGMRAQRIQVGRLSWLPLVSPALLLASRKLPWDHRRTGKVLFDVLDRLAPELNFFKYEGDPWPDEFFASSRWNGARKPGAGFDRDAAERRWRDAQAEWARATTSRRRTNAQPFTLAEAKALCRAETNNALERIISSSPELASILGPRFLPDTMVLFDRSDDKHWLLLTSKVVSLSDLILD